MAQAGMAAIPGLKDIYVQLKTRMEKAVEDFRKEMTATRTGRHPDGSRSSPHSHSCGNAA